MRTQKLKCILLTFGVVFITSCSTPLLYTSLDVLRPAQVAFAPGANNLLLVNNTVVQPPYQGHITEQLNQKAKSVTIPTDSLSIYCLGALLEDVEGKDFFTTINLIPNSTNKSNDFSQIAELDANSVKSLCQANHANVILSLDKIQVIDNMYESYVESFAIDKNTFIATIELQFESTWSIHYLNKPDVTKVKFKDVVTWESSSDNIKQAVRELPKRTDALIDGALSVGRKCVDRFIPYWDKVDRYFYDSKNKTMKQGMDSVYVKNWKSAISLWESAYNTERSRLTKSHAANNLAIAYEITGDLDSALLYARTSLSLLGELPMSNYDSVMRLVSYIEELNTRKKDIDSLKLQLAE